MKTDRNRDGLHISNISILSGIRPKGKSIDCRKYGRSVHGFLYVMEGEASFFDIDGKTLKIAFSDGELAFLPKFNKYLLKYTKNTTFVLVNFNLRDDERKDEFVFDDITLAAKEEGIGAITRIMASFELCAGQKNTNAIFRKKELMYRLLNLVYTSGSSLVRQNELDARIRDGVRLLEQSYLENLPIERFAAECYISISLFRKLFFKQFGTSPVKYRNRLRIERAKELLQDDGFSVADAAYGSGFDNIGYFCRCYRQITGETPRDTQKKRELII